MNAYLIRALSLSCFVLALGCATTTPAPESRKSTRQAEAQIPRPKLRLVNMSERSVPDRMTELASYKVMRRVSMFYKLDLFKDNSLSPAMAEVMKVGEDAVRGCYVTRLDYAPELKGQIALSFVLSKTSGTMRQIARVGGNLTDKALVQCIGRALARLPFNPPRPVRGRVLYSFNFDESVAKAP